MLNPFLCPVCGYEHCVPASGQEGSPVLIMGEFPGEEETRKGIPMCGKMGDVLRYELGRCGVDFKRLRRTNVWHHPVNKNTACFQEGFKMVIREAKGKQAILLLGSDTVKYFCNERVSDVCGLQVTSPYLSAPIIMACINPAIAFHKTIGEVRLALSKFSKRIEGIL